MKNFNIDKDVSRGSKKICKYYTAKEVRNLLRNELVILPPKYTKGEKDVYDTVNMIIMKIIKKIK